MVGQCALRKVYINQTCGEYEESEHTESHCKWHVNITVNNRIFAKMVSITAYR